MNLFILYSIVAFIVIVASLMLGYFICKFSEDRLYGIDFAVFMTFITIIFNVVIPVYTIASLGIILEGLL